MRTLKNLVMFSLLMFAAASCSEDKKKGREIDFSVLKTDLKLDEAKEKQFDEITARYKKIQKENFEAAKAQGANMDRVALSIKSEELREQQRLEIEKVLTPEQMIKFNEFIEKNSRKRPRYDNALLEKIKTEAILTDDQFAVLNASNDAFEKSFNDAHDIYHGNNDLAKEYWTKFDTQRKEAVKQILSPEQYTKFETIVKDIQFKGRE